MEVRDICLYGINTNSIDSVVKIFECTKDYCHVHSCRHCELYCADTGHCLFNILKYKYIDMIAKLEEVKYGL